VKRAWVDYREGVPLLRKCVLGRGCYVERGALESGLGERRGEKAPS